ncbi:ankyrin repeat domain-containing protein, chloroplastic-like [Copidosoma floridanum]|uniref:ankyrin repeat domain-containing protein, chloroplastic-like n=1 Tax=Copidosoma floridanum TaxID=29053 RepID=UPI000C6FC327|nr:ankyrin repeat domain-containing protein, chloroplastic-like [Copidosoma floridanum]
MLDHTVVQCDVYPLMFLYGDIRTVKLLINNGTNFHVLDKNGANLMHYAVESINHHDIVQLLLENKVDVNVSSDVVGTPLHRAVYKNLLFTVSLLVDNNADISKGDRYGRNPFVAAINMDWGITDYSCMNYLLSQKSLDINQVDLEGQTLYYPEATYSLLNIPRFGMNLLHRR